MKYLSRALFKIGLRRASKAVDPKEYTLLQLERLEDGLTRLSDVLQNTKIAFDKIGGLYGEKNEEDSSTEAEQ